MKKKCILFLLLIICLTPFLHTQKTNCNPKEEKVHIVLDKNSPKVNYRERTYIKNGIELVDKFYNIKSYGYDKGNVIEVTFIHYDPRFNFSDYDNLQHINFIRIKKSITFMDSIKYVDENFVIQAKRDFEKKLRNSRVFILDIGTIENDSIMMYEVMARYDGFDR